MHYILKTSLVSIIFFAFENPVKAQQYPIDSLQKVLMRDSLQLNDAIIMQVGIFREAYLIKAAEIRNDSGLNQQQQSIALSAIRTRTNEGIQTLLGQQKFEEYIQMIRNRTKKRNIAGKVLASSDK